MRVSLSLAALDHTPWDGTVELVRLADRSGYDTVWMGEGYGWDAAPLLGVLARETARIGLATGVCNVFSRSPAQLGQLAVTLDMLSGGRFRLGLGVSGPGVVEGFHGLRFERGVRRLRETIEIVRQLVAQRRVTHHGELFTLPGTVRMLAAPVRDRIPVYLASIAPLGIRLAGEVADGWLPAWVSPAHLPEVLAPELAAGAARAGRDPADVATCVVHNVFVADDRAAAYDLARRRVALYVGGMGSSSRNFYTDLVGRYGLAEVVGAIRSAFLDGRRERATALVTDGMIDLIAAAGTVDECREKIEEIGRLGVDEIALRIYAPGAGGEAAAVAGLAPR